MQLERDQSLHDQQFITDLYQRYWLMLLMNILAHVPSQQDAEDVLLEVYLAALESDILQTLDERRQLAWLRRVAHNKCIDYHRRTLRHPVVSLETSAETLYDNEKNVSLFNQQGQWTLRISSDAVSSGKGTWVFHFTVPAA